MDARERFEKALAKKVMAVTGIPSVVVQRPEDGEEAVYRDGRLEEVVDLGTAMVLEESFVLCVPREDEDWDCGEFIWTPAQGGPSRESGNELEVLGEYVEKRHFLIGPERTQRGPQ